MNRLTRWHLLERFWEPVRRRLFLARQLRTERDYWKERLETTEGAVAYWEERTAYWKKRAEVCEED